MKDILTVSEKTFAAMPVIDTSVALCVYGITDIAPVKEKLLGIYGDVTVTADGKTAMLSELGSAECVEIDAQPLFSKLRYNVVDAVRVTERLTQKDGGCPWGCG